MPAPVQTLESEGRLEGWRTPVRTSHAIVSASNAKPWVFRPSLLCQHSVIYETPTPLVTVSPKKRFRWFGPLCLVVLLVAFILQYRQTAQLRRAMDELRLTEQTRALNAVTEDSEGRSSPPGPSNSAMRWPACRPWRRTDPTSPAVPFPARATPDPRLSTGFAGRPCQAAR